MEDVISNLPATSPTTPPAPLTRRQGKDKPKPITKPVRELVRRMIENNERYEQAAKAIGMHVRAARKALEKQHVLNYIRQQRQVFRTSLCAGNDLRLAAIRDQDDNKLAVVQAVRALERMAEQDDERPASQRAPGVTIVVVSPGPQTTDLGSNVSKPLKIIDAVTHEGE